MGMEFANLSRLKLRKIQGGALLWSSSDTLEVVTRAWGLTEQLPSRPGGRTPGEETCTCFCIFQVFYDYVLLLGEILLNLLQ